MDDSRSIVAGVFTSKGMTDALAEIPFLIALTYALVDGLLEVSTNQVHFLPELHKNNGKTGILADGNFFLSGNASVFHQLFQNVLAGSGYFQLDCLTEGRQNVLSQVGVCFNTKISNRCSNLAGVDFSHLNSNFPGKQ